MREVVKRTIFYLAWLGGTYVTINQAVRVQLLFRVKYYSGSNQFAGSGNKIFHWLDVLTPVVLMALLVLALVLFFWFGQKHVQSRAAMVVDFLVLALYAVCLLGGYSSAVRYFFGHYLFAIPIEALPYYPYVSGLLLGSALVILYWRRKKQT